MKTGCNLVELSAEGCSSKRAVSPMTTKKVGTGRVKNKRLANFDTSYGATAVI